MSTLLKLPHELLPRISQNCCMPTVGIFRDPFSIVKNYSWKLLFIGLRAINRKLLDF